MLGAPSLRPTAALNYLRCVALLGDSTLPGQFLLKCPGHPQPQHFIGAPANLPCLLDSTREFTPGPTPALPSTGGPRATCCLSCATAHVLQSQQLTGVTLSTNAAYLEASPDHKIHWCKFVTTRSTNCCSVARSLKISPLEKSH